MLNIKWIKLNIKPLEKVLTKKHQLSCSQFFSVTANKFAFCLQTSRTEPSHNLNAFLTSSMPSQIEKLNKSLNTKINPTVTALQQICELLLKRIFAAKIFVYTCQKWKSDKLCFIACQTSCLPSLLIISPAVLQCDADVFSLLTPRSQNGGWVPQGVQGLQPQ